MVTKEEQRFIRMQLPLNDEDEAKIRRIAESGERLKISLTNDFAFKTVLHNRKVLKGLLSALLDIPVEQISDIEFPDTFVSGEYPEDKTGILDIRIHLNGEQKINIEMQVIPFPFWEERTLYYLCRMFVEGFRKGDRYEALETCVHISILNYNLFEEEAFYSEIGLWNKKTGHLYSDKMSLRVLQLNQLDKATEEEMNSELYLWARMISADDWEVLGMLAKKNEFIKEAVDELEKINSDPAKRYEYLYHEMKESDEETIRHYFTEKGRAEGKAEGKAEEEMRYSRLILKLSEAGRIDEIVKAAANPEYLQKLYQKYGL